MTLLRPRSGLPPTFHNSHKSGDRVVNLNTPTNTQDVRGEGVVWRCSWRCGVVFFFFKCVCLFLFRGVVCVFCLGLGVCVLGSGVRVPAGARWRPVVPGGFQHTTPPKNNTHTHKPRHPRTTHTTTHGTVNQIVIDIFVGQRRTCGSSFWRTPAIINCYIVIDIFGCRRARVECTNDQPAQTGPNRAKLDQDRPTDRQTDRQTHTHTFLLGWAGLGSFEQVWAGLRGVWAGLGRLWPV